MFTRARPPGLWILGSVISPAELEHLDNYYGALDSAGGTYALGAALILGGAGVTLSGTSHHVAGTLTVDNLALISIANGGSIKAEGTGSADITLAVVTNVATLTVGSGAVAKILAGGALDVYGSLTLKDASGPGSITAEDNTSITLLDGSTLTAAAGSTVNLTGATVVRGSLTIKDSGGPGSLVIETGTTSQNAGTIQHLATSINSYTSGAEETGTVTDARATSRTGKTTRTGAGAREARRTARLLADASEDVTVADDSVRVRQTMTGIHVYTLRHTGTVPTAGERIHSYRSGTTTPSAHGATFVREDSTVVFSYAASKQGFATFEFDGSDWQLVGPWGLYSSGDNSGSYGDVW